MGGGELLLSLGERGRGEPPKVLDGEEGDRVYRGGVTYPPAVAWESTVCGVG